MTDVRSVKFGFVSPITIFLLQLHAEGWKNCSDEVGKRYLKDGDDCPEQTVEVLASAGLGSNQRWVTELTSEQMHAQNTAHRQRHFMPLPSTDIGECFVFSSANGGVRASKFCSVISYNLFLACLW